MDPERQRVQEDLRGLVSGEVRCDDIFLQLYASDASIYQIRPLGVVRPKSASDVVACVQYANEHHIAVHARGAGTGLAGESLGSGLVFDFSHSMRRILDTKTDTVRVQPGVVHAQLNEHLQHFGRLFGPDPAMSDVTTMGSVIAIDASGSHRLRYGSARQHVISLQIVLADGEVLEVSRHPIRGNGAQKGSPKLQKLISRLGTLLTREAERIAQHRPATSANRSGYQLYDVLEDGHLDLAKLLVGSEGTLALVTEATLATQRLPKHRGVVLLLFESLDRASKAVMEILPYRPSVCDLMDRRHLSLARENDVRFELLIPQETEAMLLVEQDGETAEEVRRQLHELIAGVKGKKRLAFGACLASDNQEIDFYHGLSRKFVPTLYRLKGSTRPLPFVEDMAVPPPALSDFMVSIQNILKRHHVTASVFGHVGHGQLHVRPFLDLSDPRDINKIKRLAEELYDKLATVGGTISGEHADGLSRTPFLNKQFGPLMDIFRQVKAIFDPNGILNPNKIVPRTTTSVTQHLRPVSPPSSASGKISQSYGSKTQNLPPLHLAWQPDEMALTTRQCNGCGACRSQVNDVRMCPIFRYAPREEASPRAKANLMRSVLTGKLAPDQLAQEEFKAITDLCVHCQMCHLECPAEVDIPKLMLEGKASYVTTNGLRPTDWFMARIDTLSHWGKTVNPLANWAIANRQVRWVMDRILGISQNRKLPRFARHSFLQLAARKHLTRPVRQGIAKVVYFVDTYANYHDTQLAEAVVRVLEHNGLSVYVHPQQKHSGMPMVAAGAVDMARQIAKHNVDLLIEAVRQGYHIVTSEPSAALCLMREYPILLEGQDAKLVAENSSDVCHLLWKMHQDGRLRLDFRPQSVGLAYHAPCHLLALRVGLPGESLLRLIPGLSVHRIEKGCSGMAGTYGLKSENYRNSLRAGWGLISALRESPLQAGTTECSTCKMQMEQASSKPTIHPLKILALAYGLMPEVASLLTKRAEALVVT